MKLIRALHKSEFRAAILALPNHRWNYVVVEWDYHKYTTEIHQYSQEGDLEFQIVSHKKVNDQQIRRQLGDEYYFSDNWMPYPHPRPNNALAYKNKIRERMRPPEKKSIFPELTESDWEELIREAYGK